MAMLYMLFNCQDGNKSKMKMFFKIHVLYIQESQAVFNTSAEVEQERVEFIAEHCKKYGITYSVISIESIYSLKSLDLPKEPEDMDAQKYKQLHADLPIN